jgi:hypothetical protein
MTAVTQRQVFWTPVLTATCMPMSSRAPGAPAPADPPGHKAPWPGCSCGIYAWYEPNDAGILNARVFGAVQASGVVLMGDRGFRAERCTIVAVATRSRRIAHACEDAGIAVYKSRRALLHDYPPEDLTSLLGERPPAVEGELRPLGSAGVDHRMLLYAFLGRALLIGVAALMLPGIAAALVIVLVEVLLIVLLATRLP